MNDSYLNFVNSPFGARLARSLGLPKPEVLRRYRADQPEFGGTGRDRRGPRRICFDALSTLVASIGMTSVAHESARLWVPLANRHGLMTGRFEPPAPGAHASNARGAAVRRERYRRQHAARTAPRLLPRHAALARQVRTHHRAGTAAGDLRERRASGPRSARSKASRVRSARKRGAASPRISCMWSKAPRTYRSDAALLSVAALGVCVGPGRAHRRARGATASTPLRLEAAARGPARRRDRRGARHRRIDCERAGRRRRARDRHRHPRRADALDQTMPARARRHRGPTALAVDIAAPEAPAQIAAALDEQGVDIVVHNAGITQDKTIAKMTEAAWQSVIDINLSRAGTDRRRPARAGILRDGGRIIGVSSISGIAGNLGQTNYATSKAGVIGRVQSMAPHLRARGITINAVAPGFIETQMTAKIPLDDPRSRPPHEFDEPGRPAGRCRADHRVARASGIGRRQRPDRARVRTKPDWSVTMAR